MTARAKELVVGLSLDIGTGDTLRFDYRAELETPEDAVQVATLAAGSLLAIANQANDPKVQQVLREKVAGIFGVTPEQLVKGPKVQTMAEFQAEKAAKEQQAKAATTPVSAPASSSPEPASSSPAPAAVPQGTAKVPQGTLSSNPAPAAKPAPAKPLVGTCETCKAGVTGDQMKKSKLFASKVLCDACLSQACGTGGAKV